MNPLDNAYWDQWDRDDAKHCWLETACPALVSEWLNELNQTGIILHLGLERGDLNQIAIEEGTTVQEFLETSAYELLRVSE